MFRKPIRIQRPDLRADVHELIEQIAVKRTAESLPVEELLRVLGEFLWNLGRPWVIGGDFNMSPSELADTGWLAHMKATVTGTEKHTVPPMRPGRGSPARQLLSRLESPQERPPMMTPPREV